MIHFWCCHWLVIFFFRLFGLDGVMPLRIQNFQTSSQSMASLLLVRMSFVVVNFECKSVYNNFHIGGVCLSQSLLNSYTGLYKDEDRSMQGFTLFFFPLLCRSIYISYLTSDHLSLSIWDQPCVRINKVIIKGKLCY